MDHITCMVVTIGRSDNHPGPRRSSPKRIERHEAVFVRQIGDHDQRKEERLSLRLQCRFCAAFDTDLEARRLQTGSELGGIRQVRFQ